NDYGNNLINQGKLVVWVILVICDQYRQIRAWRTITKTKTATGPHTERHGDLVELIAVENQEPPQKRVSRNTTGKVASTKTASKTANTKTAGKASSAKAASKSARAKTVSKAVRAKTAGKAARAKAAAKNES
ncbi:MAG: hypothetical protein H9847_06900, partial [Candidatus Anaerobiospirillum pullicola]|nr:hypothetical protein [Candidatus Anaerobiospirillum pullicola]